jgi:glutaminyl-tRNA synthetase
MAVLRPLKVVIDNYPEGQVGYLEGENNPENPDMGTRQIPFSRVIYIEQEDFCENPPKKFFRLSPGKEVRLKFAYIITCSDVIKDDKGQVIEVHCTYDPLTKSGGPNSGKKVKGTLHWVSAEHAIKAEVRLYDYLLLNQGEGEEDTDADFTSLINPHSLEVLDSCLLEPSLLNVPVGSRYQFMREGYFCADPDSSPDKMVFNRIVGLRDTWAKIQKS